MDFLTFWQTLPLHMDPVIFRLGSFRLQWYGLMYLVAFAITYRLVRYRTRTEPERFPYGEEFLKNLLTYGFIGVLLGGRLGYVLFYNLPYYAGHPFEIILPFRSGPTGWHFSGISGMSYHGGLTGCILACALFCRKYKADFWNLADLFFPRRAAWLYVWAHRQFYQRGVVGPGHYVSHWHAFSGCAGFCPAASLAAL